jgi:hypothetical protein
MATATTGVTAFALDAYYGGEPGTIGHALFSIAGPLLSGPVAMLLFAGGRMRGGAPEKIRTSDLQLRRLPLYPAELRAHGSRVPERARG